MNGRRRLLQAAAAAATAALAARAGAQGVLPPAITPGEDLMQEHGLVSRVILIYREVIARIEAGRSFDGQAVATAARVVSRVIHNHHEREEEEVIFPALQQPREMSMLVEVLRGQHGVARALTARIGLEIVDPARAGALVPAMREFSSMYEPHGAYENTIVYPAFRQAMGPRRYEGLSRQWAEREQRLQGSFEQYVREIADAEAALGLRLALFTAPAQPGQRPAQDR